MKPMPKEVYDFRNWLSKRSKKWKAFNPDGGEKMELDHVLSKGVCDILLTLPKNWHDFKSSRQDTLSGNDKNHALIMALEGIAALMELCVVMLRWICYKLRERPCTPTSVSIQKK